MMPHRREDNLTSFIRQFDAFDAEVVEITKQEFFDYAQELACCFETEDSFIRVLEQSWGVS